MDLHSRKVTRRSLLRGVGVGALAVVASPVLFNSKTAFAAPGAPGTPNNDGSGTIIVKPARGATIAQINAKYGTRTVMTFTKTDQALVWAAKVVPTLAQMKNDRQLIAWSELNASVKTPRKRKSAFGANDDSGSDGATGLQLVSDPSLYTNQYAVAKIGLPTALATTRGTGVKIAIIDTTVNPSHPALAGKVLGGYDLVTGNPIAMVPSLDTGATDDSGSDGTSLLGGNHGTVTSGIALLAAPDARLIPIRVLDDTGMGTTAVVAEGIRMAADMGAKVLNLSLSTSTYSQALADAVDFAVAAGCVVVAAFGNRALQSPGTFPADLPNVVSVAATDQNDVKATFSNWGPEGDVAAPGVQMVGPYAPGGYVVTSGTSFSCPLVAGQVALMLTVPGGLPGLNVAPNLLSETVTNLLINTSVNIAAVNGGVDPGFGRVDVPRSLGLPVALPLGL